MVIILNYLPTFVIVVLAYYFYTVLTKPFSNIAKFKRIVFGTLTAIAIILGLQAVGPHYMPKHKIVRQPLPPIEVIEGKIQNIQPKPVSGEQRDLIRQEAYKETLPFVEQNKNPE